MYYGEIKNCDIANGVGVRVSLFVSGLHQPLRTVLPARDVGFYIWEAIYPETEEIAAVAAGPFLYQRADAVGGRAV